MIVERFFERGVYEELSQELEEKIKNGDVPVPPKGKTGALFWGPYMNRKVPVPGEAREYLVTSDGIIALRRTVEKEIAYLAEEVIKILKPGFIDATEKGTVIIETNELGTVEIRKSEVQWFYGIIFRDPKREQYVYIEGQAPRVAEFFRKLIKNGFKYRYSPGINVFFL